MDPKLIVNNIIKDFYSTRYALIGFAALLLIRFLFLSNPLATQNLHWAIFYPGWVFPLVFSMFSHGAMLLLGLVIVSKWIHADGLNDDESFWSTRPAREKHLFTAKLSAVAIAFIIVPAFLDLILGILYGAGWNLFWVLPNVIWIHGLHAVVILFLASISSNLGRMILYAVPMIALAAAYSVMTAGITLGTGLVLSVNWEFTLKLILFLGFASAYVVQSLRRDRKTAIKIAALSIFAAPLVAFPRLSDYRTQALENVTRIENLEIEQGDYIGSLNQRSETYFRVNVKRAFKLLDQDPNRILVPIKTESELTTSSGVRQTFDQRWVRNTPIHPLLYETLKKFGYDTNGLEEKAYDFNAELVSLHPKAELAPYNNEASLSLKNYFSEYRVTSLEEVPLKRFTPYRNDSDLVSIVSMIRYYSVKQNEDERILPLRVFITETEFAPGFNTGSYLTNPYETGKRLRVYFLYDPVHKLLAGGSVRPHSVIEDSQEPFPPFMPNLKRAYRPVNFNLVHRRDQAIDRGRLKLLILDLENAGSRVSESQWTFSDLSEQIARAIDNSS